MENIHPEQDRFRFRKKKENLLNQKGVAIWITGLPASGKSTIAKQLESMLLDDGFLTVHFDGDNIRHDLNNDLGFSLKDRIENIRRIAELNKVMVNSGIICINSFVSPTREIRTMARGIIGEDRFIEVFVDTPLEICKARDPKGLYKAAEAGEIKDFTGVDSVYEVPTQPKVKITGIGNLHDHVKAIYLEIINLISD